MRVTVFDYGAGNLHSLRKVIERAGATVLIEANALRLTECDLLVLPGVGAFGQAAAQLSRGRPRLRNAISAGLPVIGICLGMQLLLDQSDESAGAGLGVLPGRVTRLAASRVPHIGWNTLEAATDPALAGSGLGTPYFANSYACRVVDDTCVTAWCSHERDRFPAMVRAGSVVGTQFHPEKSGAAGVALLQQLVREAA